MEKTRVKFYGTSDLVYGYMANKAIDVLKSLDENSDSYNLNDIIELYNVYKYAENTIFPNDFPEEDKKYFDDKHKKEINKIISTFISKINDENIEILTQNTNTEANSGFVLFFLTISSVAKLNLFFGQVERNENAPRKPW